MPDRQIQKYQKTRTRNSELSYVSKFPKRKEIPRIPKIILPEKGVNDILKFTDFQTQMKCPFVIYCDFETLNRDVSTCKPNPNKSNTTTTKHLDVSSYG